MSPIVRRLEPFGFVIPERLTPDVVVENTGVGYFRDVMVLEIDLYVVVIWPKHSAETETGATGR